MMEFIFVSLCFIAVSALILMAAGKPRNQREAPPREEGELEPRSLLMETVGFAIAFIVVAISGKKEDEHKK